jgi:L-asparaginase
LRRHTYRSEFNLAGITELPRVDVILVYQGASGDLIESVVDAGARGIVVAAAGAGATSGTQNQAITYAHKRGVFTVMSTRTGSGRVIPRQLPTNEQGMSESRRLSIAHRIAAQDLAPLKARILLMLALTRTNEVAEIRRMFSEY